MTKEEPRKNGAEGEALLQEARAHYQTMLWLYQERIEDLRTRDAPPDADARKLVNGYSQAVAMLLAELRKVDQDHARPHADSGGDVFDLDALRVEIGRRLARLRSAGGAGGLPRVVE